MQIGLVGFMREETDDTDVYMPTIRTSAVTLDGAVGAWKFG